MPTFGWILLVVLVIALVAAIAVVARRGGSHTSLRRRFGPEYDRAVASHGDRRAAERHLAGIAERRDALTITPLDPEARETYTARWETLQTRFVDDPAGATAQVDVLISDVMKARGYPAGSFGERADILSADHPQLVGRYREAQEHAAAPADRAADGTSTENLRSAFVRYRELFDRLVRDDDTPTDGRASDRPAPATAGATGTPRQRKA